nr:MAG TPA: hypothetical protein [Caudoviricetes sp.]
MVLICKITPKLRNISHLRPKKSKMCFTTQIKI